MKLTITIPFAAIILSSLMGCGAFSDETKIQIEMYGVATAPEGATGDKDPQFQTYEVESITLNGGSGEQMLISTPSAFKIVDRPQILVSRIADSFVGQTFSGMTVVFAKNVSGGNGNEGTFSFELTKPTLTLTQPITLSKGNNKTIVIKAAWANTIGAGIMTEPALVIVPQ